MKNANGSAGKNANGSAGKYVDKNANIEKSG